MRNRISGVIAAVPTAFGARDEPDTRLFLEHCEWAFANGCNALNVLGTTGEANSQQLKSREKIMRAIAGSECGRRPLMVGTGTPSLHDTQCLTKLAAELEFDAALILPPYYYKPLSNNALFNYFAKVIEVISDSNMGVYLYNFPQLTGIQLKVELVAKLLEAFPQQLRGMKDSSADMAYTRRLAAVFGGVLDIFPSSETSLAEARQNGFAGCISATVNVTAPLASRAWREPRSIASHALEQLSQLRADISAAPMVAAVKTLVSMRTGNSQWLRMLPPLIALTKPERKVIDHVAEQLGYKTPVTGAA